MSTLNKKIQAFQQAMDKYHQHWYYHQLHVITAFIIITMQGFSLYFLLSQLSTLSLNITFVLPVLILAYLLTDFINGLIHMYMDNNTHYKSIVGPLIAAFHLHHKQPIYKKRPALLVYYLESGPKFWLIPYLIGLLYLQTYYSLSPYFNLLFVSIGILSSFAELSHYWCHNSSQNKIIYILQKCYLLLPKKHHMKHHIEDNKNYAFLNGLSDLLINVIAHYCYPGYKQHADQHVFFYKSKQTSNRG